MRKVNNMKLKDELITQNKTTRLYNIEVPIIGLTGGIATGKSTVSKILSEQGYAVICADQLVKSIYADQDTIDYISNNYPSTIHNNQVDFKKLREHFFSDEDVQADIEAHIYAKLPSKFLQAAHSYKENSFIIYDVPLLFEKGLDKKVDCSIVVYANRDNQIKRLMSRDNSSQELAENILEKQISIEEKKLKSDFIIDNSGNIEDLKKEVENVIKKALLSF